MKPIENYDELFCTTVKEDTRVIKETIKEYENANKSTTEKLKEYGSSIKDLNEKVRQRLNDWLT